MESDSEEERELTIDTDGGEDEPTFKRPEVPAGRVSPVLTASGSLPSYQPPHITPKQGVAPMERLNTSSLGDEGSKDTVPPPSASSTPLVERTAPTIDFEGAVRSTSFGGGRTVTKTKNNRRKQTLPSRGTQSEIQIV